MDKLDMLSALLAEFEVVDLSHTIENGMPRWPTHPHIVVYPCCTHEHDGFYNQCLVMGEHTGSHVDAPAHTVPEMKERTIDTLAPNAICAPAVVYDCREFMLGPGDRLTAGQILELENRMNLSAGEGEIAIFNFGWEKYWSTEAQWQFFAQNEPGLTEEAVELIRDRRVKAVAFDTVSSDMPIKDGLEYESTGHYKHWLPHGILLIEELKNLDKLPSKCYFVAIPLKIKGGSGSPIRPLALVDKNATGNCFNTVTVLP